MMLTSFETKVYHLLSLDDFCLATRYCCEWEVSIRGALSPKSSKLKNSNFSILQIVSIYKIKI